MAQQQNEAEAAFGGMTAAAPQAKQNPLQAALGGIEHFDPKNIGKAIIESGKHFERQPWWKSAMDVASIPAEGLANVLGAQERYVTGQANYLSEQPKSQAQRIAMEANLPGPFALAALVDPKARAAMGRGMYGVFHPNDPSLEAESEQMTPGMKKLISSDPRFRGKLQNFIVRSVFQGLKDPASYETFALAPLAESALREFEVGQRAALLSQNPVKRATARLTATNVPEKIAQTEAAVEEAQHAGTFTNMKAAIRGSLDDSRKVIAGVNTARNRGVATARELSDEDEALIAQHRDTIRAIPQSDYTIPAPDQPELFHTGLPQRPTRATYNKKFQWPAEIQARLDRAPPTDYELPNSLTERTDPESVLRAQLAQSREQIRRNVVREQLEKNLSGVPAREIRALMVSKDPARKLPTTQEILKNVAEREPKEAGPSFFRSLSDIQVDALLASGAPHMRNVTVAGLMSMPPQDVAKAMMWAATNRTPKKTIARLSEGAESHFGLGEARSALVRGMEQHVPGFRWWRKTSGQTLDRLDEALRAARLQRLDKEMPNATNFEKLDRVNQDIGEYALKPQWATYAPLAGANFPQWHGYNVPLMFARSAMRSPGRLANFGRVETNFNDQLFPDSPYRWTFGGPADEGMSAMMDPVRILGHKYPSFFGGQSTLGAGNLILRPSYSTVPERAAQYALGMLPFGNTIDEVIFNKLPIGNLPVAAANLAGFYAQPLTKSDKRRKAKAQQTLGPVGADPFASVH